MGGREERSGPWALTGARVWTGAGDGIDAEAVSFDAAGRVLAVGSDDRVLASLPGAARLVDCAGLTVVPGFVDAHTHVRAAAASALWPDCGEARSGEELLRLATAAVARAEAGATVSLAGMESTAIGTPPSRAQLDRIAPAQPLRIRDRSLHAWLLNTAAADVVAASLGGPLEDGLVLDERGEIRRAFGRVSESGDFERAVRDWSAERLRQGVTALLDASAGNDAADIAGLGRWRRSGVLAQHAVAFLGEGAATPADPDDGVPIAGTKLIFGPEPRGIEAARRRLLDAWAERPLAAIHCADLEALGDAIGAVESIPRGQRRSLRIEHASIAPPEWVGRVAASGAAVVTQPGFVAVRGDRYRDRFEAPLRPWLYRQRSWLEAGVPFAVSSDEPAGPGSPLLIWQAAVERRAASGASLGPEEALSPEQALAAMTRWAAERCGLSDLGRLAPGWRGCAVVLAGDPLGDAGPAAAEVVMTVLDGVAEPGAESAPGSNNL